MHNSSQLIAGQNLRDGSLFNMVAKTLQMDMNHVDSLIECKEMEREIYLMKRQISLSGEKYAIYGTYKINIVYKDNVLYMIKLIHFLRK